MSQESHLGLHESALLGFKLISMDPICPPPPPNNISLMHVCSGQRPAGANRRGPHRTSRASEVKILCCTDVVCPVTGSPGAKKTCAYRCRRPRSDSQPASPREGWDPVIISSRWSETADTTTKYPTHENEGNTTTSELGFIIRIRVDHDEVFIRVQLTRTP